MSKFKAGYYKADTTNGVYFYDETECDHTAELLEPREFKASLMGLDDDDSIITFLDADSREIFDEIEYDYGIN